MFTEEKIISKWIADMYDASETGVEDVEFALSVIGDAPKKILEIACGSGRILVPLARAGHFATGLDLDEDMLKKIPPKADGLQNICWRKSDVIRDDWGTGYDVVVLAANFLFNIVTDMDYDRAQALVIRKAADALSLGGHLYIDYGYTFYPEDWFDKSGENVIWQGTDSSGNTGKMVLHSSTFDRKTQLVRFTRCFALTLANGTEIRQEIPSVRHFATLRQIHEWLDSAGFVVEEEYGDYKRNPVSEATNRLILWAKKK